MDFRHSILIYHLTETYLGEAVKSISELTAISEKSITLMKPDCWGVKLVLDNEHNFRKVLSLCVLNIHGKAFSLYPLVTDLIILGSGAHIDALKVQFLLARYAPVLAVCEVTNPQGASAFRGALNYPEIPEITRLWTGSKLKISGLDGIEFSISSFCRFCRLSGHFKSQCTKIKVPFARGVTSGFPSLSDCKAPEKRKTAVSPSDSSNGFTKFAKGSPYSRTRFPNFAKESSYSKIGFEQFANERNPGHTKQNSQSSFDSNTGLANFTKASFGNSNEFRKFDKGSSDSKTEYENFAKESSDSQKCFEKFAKGSNPGLQTQHSQTSFDSKTGLANFTKASFDSSNGFIKYAKGSSDCNTEYENFKKESSDNKIEFEKFTKGSNPGLTKQKSLTNFDSNKGLANFTKTSFSKSNGFTKYAKRSSDSNTEYKNFAKESSDSKIGFEKFTKGSNPVLTTQQYQTSFDSKTGLENFTKASFDSNNGFSKFDKGGTDSNIEYGKLTKGLTKQKSQTSFDNNTGSANFIKASFDSSNGFMKFATESSNSNTEYENFAKRSSDGSSVCRSDYDMNKESAFEASSSKALSPSTSLKHLIPSSMQNDIEALKLFFSHCKNFKHLYKSALRYPSGVGILLRQLRQIVKFSKNIKTKSEDEIKFIAWVCLLLSKLQYYHLKKNIQLEPFYAPPL